MVQQPLNQSSWIRARQDTATAFHTIRFWLFEVCTLAGLTVWVLIWQPDWIQDRWTTVYQILIPLIGVFVGLAMLFLLSLIVAPYRHRREARSHIATLQAEIAEVRKERDEAQSRLFAMPDELVAQTLRGLSIRIADLARESDIIRRKTFVDCHIYGPALIYPANSIVVHCQFDGGLEDTFVTTTNDAVVGAIRLEDCTVRECSLHRIGFIGSPEEIKKAKENAQSP